MNPDDEIPEAWGERLRDELDALPLRAVSPGQARYRSAARRSPAGWRGYAGALAAAAVAAFLLGVAVGGLNPATWTSRTAGAMQRLRDAIGGAAATSPTPAATPTPTEPGARETSPAPGEGSSEGSTGGAAAGESGEPSPEPTTGEGSGEPSPEPSASPTPDGGGSDGGGGGEIGTMLPSPSPTPGSDGG